MKKVEKMNFYHVSAETAGLLQVASCDSMAVKDITRACNNMFDGSLSSSVKEGSCLVTKSNFKGWLEVKLARTSVVNKLVILPKGDGTDLVIKPIRFL